MTTTMRQRVGRRYRLEKILVVSAFITLGTISMVTILGPSEHASSGLQQPPNVKYGTSGKGYEDLKPPSRHLLAVSAAPEETAGDNRSDNHGNATIRGGEFPPEVFTEYQLRHGAVILYIVGMIYMFVALAIVCDEFFVPALEVITDKSGISEDVAGATFMAAGGSAPELFTNLIGVFAGHSDMGIGTIVGSAVFNILFVIGMCALVSAKTLQLTWWPLFRDVSFYSISLVVLILFFQDQRILWWESLVLLSLYVIYVIFMKCNRTAERLVKTTCSRNRVSSACPRSTDNLVEEQAQENGYPDHHHKMLLMHTASGKFRHGVLQLMIHTIDPLGEAKVHDKALKLHTMAQVQVVMNGDNHNIPHTQNYNGTNKDSAAAAAHARTVDTAGNGEVAAISNGVVVIRDPGSPLRDGAEGGGSPADTHPESSFSSWSPGPRRNHSQQTTVTSMGQVLGDYPSSGFDPAVQTAAIPVSMGNGSLQQQDGQLTSDPPNAHPNQQADDINGTNEPLDMSWPDSHRKRLTYIIVAPIIVPLWLTLPDVRRPERRYLYPWTFTGSILWIAGFSYLMTWWASTTGRIIGIREAVMGLTFLAAGTSIPDLITSVIVAKKGFGDMAVSSSIGSNIFDVTVGLPFPWLLYTVIYNQAYQVNSNGLFCSIVLLFGMLLFVIVLIASFRWKMNKSLGACFFALYAIFLTISLLLEYNIIVCSV